MFRKKLLLVTVTAGLVFVSGLASSTTYVKTGTIKRSLADSGKYGGCMIQLDSIVGGTGNSCPASSWVSLDCDANHLAEKTGDRLYQSAMVAASLKQRVSISIDDTKKNTGYCVVTRIDVIF